MTINEFNSLKLWEAAELALRDLELCEQDPKVRISMSNWVRPEGDVCAVCLAGAVLYREFGTRHADRDELPRMAYAIDWLRRGIVHIASRALKRPADDQSLDRIITDYRSDPERFKTQFRTLIADLKAADL